MGKAVLEDVDAWFEHQIFEPLRTDAPNIAIARMWESVDSYFRSGARICIVGTFALGETRDRFADVISGYFDRWIASLRDALVRDGWAAAPAEERAEDIVLGIQGALVLARASRDNTKFTRAIARLKARLQNCAA